MTVSLTSRGLLVQARCDAGLRPGSSGLSAQAAGCPSYWVVDPAARSVTVWELRDGSYAEIGTVTGEDELAVDAPFPVRFRPDDLLG